MKALTFAAVLFAAVAGFIACSGNTPAAPQSAVEKDVQDLKQRVSQLEKLLGIGSQPSPIRLGRNIPATCEAPTD